MNYRKKYKAKYGELKIGQEIHHIDGDRENNSIENLVEISPDLHKRYHQAERKVNQLATSDIKKYSRKKLEKLRDNLFVFMTTKEEIMSKSKY